MLRIFRAKTSELDSRVIKFIPLYDAFYKEIYEKLEKIKNNYKEK